MSGIRPHLSLRQRPSITPHHLRSSQCSRRSRNSHRSRSSHRNRSRRRPLSLRNPCARAASAEAAAVRPRRPRPPALSPARRPMSTTTSHTCCRCGARPCCAQGDAPPGRAAAATPLPTPPTLMSRRAAIPRLWPRRLLRLCQHAAQVRDARACASGTRSRRLPPPPVASPLPRRAAAWPTRATTRCVPSPVRISARHLRRHLAPTYVPSSLSSPRRPLATPLTSSPTRAAPAS